MRKRLVVATLVACVSLAVPAGASAHARSPAVALDYRLVLSPAAREIPGVGVAILDGDRDLRLTAHGVTIVVRGDLGEPMLRIEPAGVWVNRGSVTAVAEKLTTSSRGWVRIGGGPAFAWHEHRLAPPPYDRSRMGTVARFAVPVTVDGRVATIGGSFVRYERPALWLWLGGAAAISFALALVLWRIPSLRRPVAVGVGAAAGLAALAGLVAFDAADAPNGRVAWVQIVLGLVLAAAVYGTMARLHGARRAHLAGVLGVVAGAVTLGSLDVFRHGVVISLVPGTVSRLLCAVGLAGGMLAAASSYLLEDEA